ncbi:hypothetical protein MPC4_960001 [Methylocella tundrae]|uniref:Uncharacterized protein n=1 Tax=Methylocella tundrae TaxID=227605 RepID=A0A8B6MCW4_METTU|nr:hypothetical protein MPC4_960001 [Methylocella tundrae]
MHFNVYSKNNYFTIFYIVFDHFKITIKALYTKYE